jgi:hypothetical protein
MSVQQATPSTLLPRLAIDVDDVDPVIADLTASLQRLDLEQDEVRQRLERLVQVLLKLQSVLMRDTVSKRVWKIPLVDILPLEEFHDVDLVRRDTFVSKMLCCVDGDPKKLPAKVFENVTSAGATITFLKLTKLQGLALSALKSNAKCFPNLFRLQLNGSTLLPNTLSALRYFPKLEWLNLSHCKAVNDSSLQGVMERCPQLVGLYLKGCAISDKGLSFLVGSKIKVLNLSSTGITDTGLRRISQLPLEELTVAFSSMRRGDTLAVPVKYLNFIVQPIVSGVTSEGFLHVVNTCKTIRKIDIFGCTSITQKAITQAQTIQTGLCVTNSRLAHDIEFVTPKCSGFEVQRPIPESTPIEFATPFAQFAGGDFKDGAFISQLLKLTKGNLYPLLRVFEKEIEKDGPGVEFLVLTDCLLTRDKLELLSKHFPHVQSLTYTGVQILDFRPLCIFTKLTGINLSGYADSGLNTKQFVDAIIGCVKLERLDVSHTELFGMVLKGIISVKCKDLKEINITGCRNITDETAQVLRERFDTIKIICHETDAESEILLKQLSAMPKTTKTLKLCGEVRVKPVILGEKEILALIKYLPNLESLYLDRVIFQPGRLHLVSKLPFLQELSLSQTAVNDIELMQLSFCPRLEVLDISECQNVSELGLTELVKRSKTIKEINITNCERIDRSSIHQVKKQKPKSTPELTVIGQFNITLQKISGEVVHVKTNT